MGSRTTTSAGLTRTAAVVCAVTVLTNLSILLLSPWPPTNDASSHTATAVIFHQLAAGGSPLREHYEFSSTPLPYWSVTWILSGLQHAVSPAMSWQLLMCLYALATAGAYAWLLYELNPGSRLLAGLGAATVFNWAYFLGEANFVISQPLALLGFVLWWRAGQSRWPASVAFVLTTALLYLSHVFGLVALVAAMGMLCVGDLARRLLGAPFPALRPLHWALALGSLGLVLVAAWLIFGAHGTDANQGHWVFRHSPYRLAQIVTHPLKTPTGRFYYSGLLVIALLGVVLLISGPLSTLRRRVVWPLALPALGFFFLAYLGPAGVQEEFGFEDIGERFSWMCLLFALGAVRLGPRRWTHVAALALVTTVCIAKCVDAWTVHRDYQERGETIATELIDRVPEGACLVPIQAIAEPSRLDGLYHRFGNWAVVRRHAYNPHIFARTGQQPLNHIGQRDFRQVTSRVLTDDERRFFSHALVQDGDLSVTLPNATRLHSAAGFTLWALGGECSRPRHTELED